MISVTSTILERIVLQKVGNKLSDEGIHYAKSYLNTSDKVKTLLLHYFVSPFKSQEYYNTQNILSFCKNFVKNGLSQYFEIPKADQVDLLNKSVKFFKENDYFNMTEFANEVICQPEIESFNQYKSSFQQDYDVGIADNFAISESAVKKQARSLKSVIKPDKNFHIYIHGDRELIEQGEDKKGKFYKVYYEEES